MLFFSHLSISPSFSLFLLGTCQIIFISPKLSNFISNYEKEQNLSNNNLQFHQHLNHDKEFWKLISQLHFHYEKQEENQKISFLSQFQKKEVIKLQFLFLNYFDISSFIDQEEEEISTNFTIKSFVSLPSSNQNHNQPKNKNKFFSLFFQSIFSNKSFQKNNQFFKRDGSWSKIIYKKLISSLISISSWNSENYLLFDGEQDENLKIKISSSSNHFISQFLFFNDQKQHQEDENPGDKYEIIISQSHFIQILSLKSFSLLKILFEEYEEKGEMEKNDEIYSLINPTVFFLFD